MKFIFFFVFVYAFTSNLYGQTDYFDSAIVCLKSELPIDFKFGKSMRIDVSKCGKTEYSFVMFSEDNNAFLTDNLNGDALGIIAELYDSNRNLVASNFNGKNTERKFFYIAKKMGIYYLRLRFHSDFHTKDIRVGGVVVFGLKRLENYLEKSKIMETEYDKIKTPENVPDLVVENRIKPSEDAVEKQLKIYGDATTEKQHLEKIKTYHFYPQPVTDFLQTDIDTIADLILFDASGKKIREIKQITGTVKIDVRDLLNGIYFILIRTDEAVWTQKVIVNKN